MRVYVTLVLISVAAILVAHMANGRRRYYGCGKQSVSRTDVSSRSESSECSESSESSESTDTRSSPSRRRRPSPRRRRPSPRRRGRKKYYYG